MKNMRVLLCVVLLLSGTLFAGGVVTNTNQSAAFMRTLNRNASTDVDAVYFNPAGLTKLCCNGLFLDISNQSIWQKKTVTDNTLTLNKDEFVGDVAALVFPTAYVAYKMDKLVLSAGFMPIGGGGSATYEKGLPSFEVDLSKLPAAFAAQGATGYELDVNFEGSSTYLGVQGGVSYKINDMISVYGGARYVMANNSYTGYLKNINLITPIGPVPADNFMNAVATQLSSTASSLQPLIDGGAGIYTLAQAQGAGLLSAAQVAQIEGGLTQVGVDPTGLTISDVQTAYTAKSVYYDKATEDKEVDAKRSGGGITPIISVNLSMKDLNVGIRYEMKTTMEMENETKTDDTGLFPDKAKYGSDLPSQLAVGVSYKMGKLKLMSDFNYFGNTGVDWDGAEVNFDNSMEAGVAAEYSLTEKLKVSLGGLYSKQGATDESQSDMDFNLDTYTIGGGLLYAVTPKIQVNLGALNTTYFEG
ncbi:MAG: transporter, partial [Candidatus Neomarinimicrobiota bacterium]